MLCSKMIWCDKLSAEVTNIVIRHNTLFITFQLQDHVHTSFLIGSLIPFGSSRSHLACCHHNEFLLNVGFLFISNYSDNTCSMEPHTLRRTLSRENEAIP
jgi:hypothetical protein